MPPTAAKKLPTPPKTPALAAAAAYNGPRKLTASATTSKTSNVTAAGSEKQKPAQARKESGKADSLTKKQEGETTTVKDSTPKLPAATKKPQPPVTRHEPRPPAAARRIATAFGSSFAAKQPNKKPKGSITRGGSEALTSSTTTPKQVSK